MILLPMVPSARRKEKRVRDLLLSHCGSSAGILSARSGRRALSRSRRGWEVHLWGGEIETHWLQP